MEGRKRKRPYLAAALSFFLPGLGQIYNGQFAKGVAVFALVVVVNTLSRAPLEVALDAMQSGAPENVSGGTWVLIFGYGTAMIFLVGLSMYDALATAGRINEDMREGREP